MAIGTRSKTNSETTTSTTSTAKAAKANPTPTSKKNTAAAGKLKTGTQPVLQGGKRKLANVADASDDESEDVALVTRAVKAQRPTKRQQTLAQSQGAGEEEEEVSLPKKKAEKQKKAEALAKESLRLKKIEEANAKLRDFEEIEEAPPIRRKAKPKRTPLQLDSDEEEMASQLRGGRIRQHEGSGGQDSPELATGKAGGPKRIARKKSLELYEMESNKSYTLSEIEAMGISQDPESVRELEELMSTTGKHSGDQEDSGEVAVMVVDEDADADADEDEDKDEADEVDVGKDDADEDEDKDADEEEDADTANLWKGSEIMEVDVDLAGKKKGVRAKQDVTLLSNSVSAAGGKKIKIRLQDFPNEISKRIADVGNKHMRAVISLANGFPAAQDKVNLAWSSAEQACANDKILTRALRYIEKEDPKLQSQIIDYINYAPWSMRGDIRKHSVALIRKHYDLENLAKKLGPEEMAKLVAWLAPTDPQALRPFTFGELDLEARTYNKKKNHACELVKEVIHAVWFHKKKDPEAVQWQDDFADIPLPLLAMVFTAVSVSI
ncbi:hypothetical protein BV25DRAFT_1843096 [Artomyces pyxidatus]|uniref:Uncharacterized protein n=1 Tax=Artomyces pyxidatus TaxID=48021 RepID=A0ACB8SH26_9AGAM|nr:hypothetical protein BV25DRAFT_1843096 [Artomyces pyxidatus]